MEKGGGEARVEVPLSLEGEAEGKGGRRVGAGSREAGGEVRLGGEARRWRRKEVPTGGAHLAVRVRDGRWDGFTGLAQLGRLGGAEKRREGEEGGLGQERREKVGREDSFSIFLHKHYLNKFF